MKSKVLKSIAAVGIAGLFTMAGTASASGYYHSEHDDYYHSDSDDYYHTDSDDYYHSDSDDYYHSDGDDDQVHTYHTAEHPFIW